MNLKKVPIIFCSRTASTNNVSHETFKNHKIIFMHVSLCNCSKLYHVDIVSVINSFRAVYCCCCGLKCIKH